MLQLQAIREQKDEIIIALKKRNVDATPLLENVISLDDKRRDVQTKLDNTLAESNKLSKEIGMLFKSGKASEANVLKERTVTLKEDSKTLQEELNTVAEELQALLYQIPNVPHPSVPAGSTDEDNEEIFREGDIPKLIDGALPHWNLLKNTTL